MAKNADLRSYRPGRIVDCLKITNMEAASVLELLGILWSAVGNR